MTVIISSVAAKHWLWMKDTKSRLHNPIDLVDYHDQRSAVRDLLDEHRSELCRLYDAIHNHPLFEPSKHDDLWLLRFLLSHKRKHSSALKAAISTLEFRHEHHLDEYDIRGLDVNNIKAFINNTTKDTHPYAESLRKIMACIDENTILSYIPDSQRGVLYMCRIAGADDNRLIKELTEEEYFQGYLFATEWVFQWLDRITRSTGLLTKCLRLADADGATVGLLHAQQRNRESRSATMIEDFYPQLVSSLLIVNAPTWANMVFSLVKPFTPKRVLQKISLIKPLKRKKDLARILEHCAKDKLPVRFGGTLEEYPPRNMVAAAVCAIK